MVSWLQFQEWPNLEIPIPGSWEVWLAERIGRRLEAPAGSGVVTSNWPYRPAPNLQLPNARKILESSATRRFASRHKARAKTALLAVMN